MITASALTHFLKGIHNDKTVTLLNTQESYRFNSFARGNCLIQINKDITECKQGDLVNIHLLSL
jgi:molybdopterin biosynthesis enzyme